MTWLAVALAGAAGALTRYALGLAVGQRSFPWTTLAINVTGSFLLAVLIAGPLGPRRDSAVTLGLTVGFLGAFTTFSTFGLETVELLHADRAGTAAAYVGASMIVGLTAAAAGYWLGQRLGST